MSDLPIPQSERKSPRRSGKNVVRPNTPQANTVKAGGFLNLPVTDPGYNAPGGGGARDQSK